MAGRTVCVVGAGSAGLVTVKECVDNGLTPTCLELNSQVGGMWQGTEGDSSNFPSLWPNFVTNSCKWGNSYSHFPPDPTDPPYLTRELTHLYYERYTDHCNLRQYIRFNTRVVWVTKSLDHQTSGRWDVFTCPTSDFRQGDKRSLTPDSQLDSAEKQELLARCKKETYDFVIVCSGYCNYAKFPPIPGLSEFQGSLSHAMTYKGSRQYEGRRVLVVGNQFSAADIAQDISVIAKQTYLAVGEGTWIIPRVFPGGKTVDQMFSRSFLYDRKVEQKMNDLITTAAQNRLDHWTLGIVPPYQPCYSPLAIGDGLAVQISSGRVQVYGRLAKLTTHEAVFRDGQVIAHLDAVVFCTGYGLDLSFVDADIVQANGRLDMYKMTFPAQDRTPHTLAFVGVVNVDSPVNLVYEMQARLVTSVMAGQAQLPSKAEMQKDADYWSAQNWQRKRSYRYYLPGYDLADSIASAMGVYPSFWKLLLKDPLLAYRVWYGSIVNAHHRLVGPGNQWQRARELSHAQYEEGTKALCHIRRQDSSQTRQGRRSVADWLKCLSVGVVVCSGLAYVAKRGWSS